MSDMPQQSDEPQSSEPPPSPAPPTPTPSPPDGQPGATAGQYPPSGQYPPPQYPPPGQYPATGGYAPPAGAQPMTPSDERLWAMLSQLGGLIFGFVPALIIMLVFGDRSPFVRRHAVEALNFQITLIIAYIVAGLSILILIGIVLLPIILVASIVFMIIAGLAANRGEDYRFPINIRFVH